jgi:hypothetical protein
MDAAADCQAAARPRRGGRGGSGLSAATAPQVSVVRPLRRQGQEQGLGLSGPVASRSSNGRLAAGNPLWLCRCRIEIGT